MNNISRLTVVILSTLALSACVIHVGSGSYQNPGSSTDSVFGDVRVASGQTVGNVSSVNGSVLLSHRVVAKRVSTVNGNVEVGDYNQVRELSTVNGSISAGVSLESEGKVETVNGDIRLRNASVIGGKVSTVNGDIDIDSAEIKNNVETHTGDISVEGQSTIDGDIRFKHDHSDGNNFLNNTPTLFIGQQVTLKGQIYLEREVKLEIADSALTKKVVYLFREK